jgi:hypothetical protein
MAYVPVYPKRRYVDASEVAVGDVVRLEHFDHNGDPCESPSFSDLVVGAISAHPIPEVTLHRPHLALLDGKPVLFAECFAVELHRLVSRFHVCTTGHRGDKQQALHSAHTPLFLATHCQNPLENGIHYRLCAGLHCESLVVGSIGSRCHTCIASGNPTSYFTILIPWSDTPTQWHPTRRDCCPITRGAFRSVSAANDWARENLNGQPCEVKRVSERGLETIAAVAFPGLASTRPKDDTNSGQGAA